MPYSRSVPSLPLPFNVQDEKLHKKLRNPIAPIFSLSNILTLERLIDQVMELFFQQLDKRFAESHETFDLGDWLEFFAFDVMGTMTFSKRYGFLENGRDDKKLMKAIWNLMEADAPVSLNRILPVPSSDIALNMKAESGFNVIRFERC